jgi:predicted GTPase
MTEEELIPDLSKLERYTRIKQGFAYEIRLLLQFFDKHLGERYADECRDLMAKLAEDRFTLTVVGQFKRGKSTLMNAVMGRDLLPTGVLPLTSAITILRYGPKERLLILKQGSSYQDEVPVSSLAEYVTENGNSGNAKRVAHAYLELPSKFLRRGLEFVDTPGIGSTIEANTATTYHFLPRSDAVIFVTGVDTPLTRVEKDFLQSIRENVNKVFFVLNKIDLADAEEKDEILSFISEALKEQTGVDDIRIFPVSSAMALASKLSGDEEEYEKSGVKAFQEALSDFLSNEKSNTLLVSVLDKAIRLATGAFHELSLLKAAAEVSQGEAGEKGAALEDRFQALREIRGSSLLEARERVISQVRELVSSELVDFLEREAVSLREKLDKDLSRFNWKLSSLAMQETVKNRMPDLKHGLGELAKQQTERMNPEITRILSGEWERMKLELHKIPSAADEVLGDFITDFAPDGESSELPFIFLPRQADFTKIEWSPGVPVLQAQLPVFLVRSFLKEYLGRESENFLSSCMDYLEHILVDGVSDSLNRISSEVEKRAEEIEGHILQAMKGKRFLPDIAGKWRISELDKNELIDEIRTLRDITGRFRSIRNGILKTESVPTRTGALSEELSAQEPESSQTSGSVDEVSEGTVEDTAGTDAEIDFHQDLDTRGCPVCNHMIQTAFSFYAHRQYALATQEHAQRTHAAALGFCPLHTWQLAGISSPKGLSQAYPALMERLSDELSRLAESETPDPAGSLMKLVPDPGHCRVCNLIEEVEREYLKGLAEFIQSPEGYKTYANSQGVCLHHLGKLIDAVPSKERRRSLIEHASRRFAELSEDMQNYALKRDALKHQTINRDEADAHLRGLVHSVGAKKLCSSWGVD